MCGRGLLPGGQITAREGGGGGGSAGCAGSPGVECGWERLHN